MDLPEADVSLSLSLVIVAAAVWRHVGYNKLCREKCMESSIRSMPPIRCVFVFVREFSVL